ncbi:MAG TPA: hypothetical protein VFZ61_20505 [Polyangiales bacterium]
MLVVAPLSPEGLRFVSDALEQGRVDEARSWAEQAVQTHVGQLLRAGLVGSRQPDDDLSDLLFDLQARSLVRLRALRVGATIASTTGLLVGILRIRGGLGPDQGLLALEAGLAEKVALGQALSAMAIGIGTSAVCFYALGVLREAAKAVLTQGTKVAGVLRRGRGGWAA